jgi:hypothetical protein
MGRFKTHCNTSPDNAARGVGTGDPFSLVEDPAASGGDNLLCKGVRLPPLLPPAEIP